MGGGAAAIDKKTTAVSVRILLWCCLGIYLFAVLWYTLMRRSPGYYLSQYDLFWSYRLWFEGDWGYGKAILANIAMFIPFGFLLMALKKDAGGGKDLFLVFLLSLAFSALIETMQFTLMRGSFEFDDICNNASGAVLGALLFWLSKRFLPERIRHMLLCGACAGIMLFCFALFAFEDSSDSGSQLPLPQGMCFQIEEASLKDGRLETIGICFWYERDTADYTIVLQSTRTKERYALNTECSLPRPDVAAYFNRDYLNVGFQAAGPQMDKEEEYEIILDFGFFRAIATGVYLSIEQDASVSIHYFSNDMVVPLRTKGTDLEEIVNDGVLKVYNPGYHVYVYLYEDCLYWIVEDGFKFEADGTTCLELVLCTTEKERLSAESLAAGKDFDSFPVIFEQCEMQGDFGRYRVCARELPTDYPITLIRTGYYSKGWVWRKSFWPVFDFQQQ